MEHIFLHGLGQTPKSWEAVTKKLGNKANCPDLSALPSEKPLTYAGLYRAFAENVMPQRRKSICAGCLSAVCWR